ANASRAFLYETKHLRTELPHLLQSFKHPQSRDKKHDLTADKPGHYQTSHTARSAYESQTDPKKIEAKNFSMELAKTLLHNEGRPAFTQLILVMPSHFYGLFKEHFHCKTPDLKINHINKDYTRLKIEETTRLLRKEFFE
ncbi:MAG: host attachment protein, partial [Gammaproteobacteria bacterium]|nr:host attachment protein [Gammaproteobacteria bacterium]